MLDDAPLGGSPFAKVDIRTQIRLKEIQSGFRHIPRDTYVHDGTRFKDIARFLVGNGRVTKSRHGPLFHPTNSGSYGGLTERLYSEVPDNEIGGLVEPIEIFAHAAGIAAEQEILLQRQRVTIGPNGISLTVREGPHQDGVKKLALLCVNRANIKGGISLIYDKNRTVTFAGILEPGEMLLIDDAKIWHDASPIQRLDPSCPGHRDILIITSPACREHPRQSRYAAPPRQAAFG
jgi:hypothetical protein